MPHSGAPVSITVRVGAWNPDHSTGRRPGPDPSLHIDPSPGKSLGRSPDSVPSRD